jgi:hypothetical protein
MSKIVIREVDNATIGKARFKPTIKVWHEGGEDGINHMFFASCRLGEDTWSIYDEHAFAPRTRRRRGPRKLADPEILVGTREQVVARLREIVASRLPGLEVEVTMLDPDDRKQKRPAGRASQNIEADEVMPSAKR